MMKRFIGLFILLFVLASTAGCWSTLDSGEAGVWYSSIGGTNPDVVAGEGMNGHAPWTNVIKYNVRTQNALEKMAVLDKNGLEVDAEISILYKPDVTCLPKLHVTYGEQYYDQLIVPNFRSAVRETVGIFTSEQLYAQGREQLQAGIFQRMKEATEGECVIVDDVLIRDVNLPDNIRKAIERKLEEEQKAATYVYTLRKDSLEARRRKIEADGIAKYNRTLEKSMTPNVLRYEAIKATKELANSNNSKIVVMGGNDNGGLPIIMNDQ